MNVLIKKASGSEEDFLDSKFLESLKRCGADPKTAQKILKQLRPFIEEGLSTKEIRRLATRFLRKESKTASIQYHLKKAILDLGPDGYAFEKFIGKILQVQGFQAINNQVLKGRCVSHEVDIIAVNNKTLYIECKFHNNQGHKNDIKTALYIYARSLDLKENPNNHFDEYWIASNTKFSQDAIDYAKCVGIKLLSITYPEGKGIADLIKRYHIHPITCLTHLKKSHVKALIKKDIVLCQDLAQKPEVLKQLNLTPSQEKTILNEVYQLKKIIRDVK